MMSLTSPGAADLAPAETLKEAWDALEPVPLTFEGKGATGALYAPRPDRFEGPLRVGGPAETLARRLLESVGPTKVFLSGHVGSGKSTEILRLAASKAIRAAFLPVFLAIEEGHRQQLSIAHLLFLMACALHETGKQEGLLSKENAWIQPLRDLDQRLFGASGLQANQGNIGVEVDLFLVKLRQDLRLEPGRRRQFRELGETHLSLLLDLLRGLEADIRLGLARRGDARTVLLLIDDLDKVREKEPQDDVFRSGFPALIEPPFRVLYTVPTGVAFGHGPQALRQSRVHLYPVPILDKQAPGHPVFDPEQSLREVGLPFLEAVLCSRVRRGLFDANAIRSAAACSGGVLRSFFWLLRAGVDVARANNLDTVDGAVMRVAIKNERLNESQTLRARDYKILSEVHHTNDLPEGADTSYLDNSYVIECYNDKVWYVANPLLWPLLRP